MDTVGDKSNGLLFYAVFYCIIVNQFNQIFAWKP